MNKILTSILAVLLALAFLSAGAPVYAGEEARIEGTIDKIVKGEDLPEMARAHGITKILKVDGVKVLFNEDTRFEGMLEKGDEVEISGKVKAILAEEIELVEKAGVKDAAEDKDTIRDRDLTREDKLDEGRMSMLRQPEDDDGEDNDRDEFKDRDNIHKDDVERVPGLTPEKKDELKKKDMDRMELDSPTRPLGHTSTSLTVDGEDVELTGRIEKIIRGDKLPQKLTDMGIKKVLVVDGIKIGFDADTEFEGDKLMVGDTIRVEGKVHVVLATSVTLND